MRLRRVFERPIVGPCPTHVAVVGVLAGLLVPALVACGGDDAAPTESIVIPALDAGSTDAGSTDTGSTDATGTAGTDISDTGTATRADVVRAAEAAVAAAGGEAIDTAVDLMGYVVQLRQDDGALTTVQLDVGFGVVFVEDVEPGDEGDRVDRLADDVDLRRAVDVAREAAAGEIIGAARDGVVVGVELEPGEYDVDIQYPDGRVLEVRVDDTTFVPTGTRLRDG